MKIVLYVFLCIIIAYSCTTEVENNYNTNLQELEISLSDSTILIRKTDSAHLAFPDIIKNSDTSLIVVYREGFSHVDTSGKIAAQYGSINGKKWSEPITLIDDTLIDDRDPSLAILDKQLFVNYFKYAPGMWYKKPTICHIHAWQKDQSSDTPPVETQVDPGHYYYQKAFVDTPGYWADSLSVPIYNYGCSSNSIFYKNKQVIAGYGGHPLVRIKDTKEFSSPLSHIKFFERTEKDLSWKARNIEIPETDTLWLQEPSLLNVNSADTLLIMHIRTAYGRSIFDAGHMVQTISKDGKNWTSPYYFPFIGHSPDLFQTSSGVIFCGFRMVNDSYTEESVAFIYSKDWGKSWSDPVIIEHSGEEECGYPSFEEISENEIIMVYYSDNGTTIKARKIFISQL